MAERKPFPPDPRYSVTDDGRVFRDVHVGHHGTVRELTQHVSKRGYYIVHFELRGKTWPVHRMVALTFIPNPDDKPEVAHNDGVKLNNDKSNLRWATRQENSDDIDRHGTRAQGEGHPSHILTEEQALEIHRLTVKKAPRQHPYHREIAERFGVTRECVTRIANENRWVHATAAR